MICLKCGKKYDDESLFCIECGSPLQKEMPAEEKKTPQEPVAQPVNPQVSSVNQSQPVNPQGRPVNQGQPVNPQGRPVNQGQPVNPQGRPVNQGQPVNPQGRPVNQGQPVNPQGRPVNQGQPVNPQGRPVNQGQPVNPQGRPVNQGQPVNPQGRPVNQGQPMNPYGRPVKQKKPVSKMAIVVAVEAVVAVALVVGMCTVLNNRFSPDTVAEKYWTAVAERDWNQAYEYCDFPENQLLSKEMYVMVNADNTEPLNYKSVQVKETREMAENAINDISSLFGMDGGSYSSAYNDYADAAESSDLKSYVVEYMEKGDASKSYDYLSLTKTGEKKLLFWDEWKVASSDSWVQDVSYTIPKNATLTLNGVAVNETNATVDGNQKTICIPYLFSGNYQMMVTEDGMKPLCCNMSIYAGSDSYTWNLVPDEETMKALGQQAGSDIQKIIESALKGESFASVQDLFLTSAVNNGSIKDDYESLVGMISTNGGRLEIISLQIKDFKAVLDDMSIDNELCLKVTANWDETYKGYFSNSNVKGNATIYMYYVKDGDAWKLTTLPIDGYDF